MSDPSILETFEFTADSPFSIEHINEEFTSVCPVTGHPDFGTILLRYEPNYSCVELKSLKLYYQSFRDEGIYYEAVTNKMRDDLVLCLKPKWLQIITNWKGRGGIRSSIIATYGEKFFNPFIRQFNLGLSAFIVLYVVSIQLTLLLKIWATFLEFSFVI